MSASVRDFKLVFAVLLATAALLLASLSASMAGAATGGLTVSTVGSIGNQFAPRYNPNPADGSLWTMTTAGFDSVGKITLAGVFTNLGTVGGGGGAHPFTLAVLSGLGTKGRIYVYDCNYGGTWFYFDAAGGRGQLATGATPTTGVCNASIMGVSANSDGTKLYHHVGTAIYEINPIGPSYRVVASDARFSGTGIWELEWDTFTGTLLGHGPSGGRDHLYRIDPNTGSVVEIAVPLSLDTWNYTVPNPDTGLIYLDQADTVYQLDPVSGQLDAFTLAAGSFAQFSTFGPARSGTGRSLYGIAGAPGAYRVVEIAGSFPLGDSPPTPTPTSTPTPTPTAITDSTPPSAAPAQSPAANGAGWNNSDVTVNWNWTDEVGGSGTDPSSCTTSSTSTGEGSIALNATCKDVAGNEGSASYTVKVDQTAPAVTAERAPAANAAGWNNGPVSVHFGASDGLSGIEGDSFFDVFLDVEGANQGVDHTFWDNAGNPATASVTGVNIDLTRPQVIYSGNNGTYNVDETVNITCAPSDSLSGIASTTCAGATGPAYSFPPGANILSATATDNAGNNGSGSTTFSVVVTCDGLAGLTRQFVTKVGAANSLLAKLDSACKAGNANAKAGVVGAFINEVQAQTNKAVSAEHAAILINLARAL